MIAPGQWAYARSPSTKELAATTVLPLLGLLVVQLAGRIALGPRFYAGLALGVGARRKHGRSEELLVEAGVPKQQMGRGRVFLLLRQRIPDRSPGNKKEAEQDQPPTALQNAERRL